MKTKLLLLIALLNYTISNAQCATTVSNFGNNVNITSYNISGDVSVTLNTDNTVTLDLGSNFSTASGPDVRAYLVKSNGNSNVMLRSTLISNLEHIEFGLVGSLPGFGNPVININGQKSFTVNVPDIENIQEYDTVIFYCLLFDQFWDLGTFTAFNTSNCAVLNTSENSVLDTVSFYPNPTENVIHINNNKELNLNIDIINVLGEKMYSTNISNEINPTLNISALNSGVYLVQITSNNQTITKRLIKD